ncbi:MAG: hypothetical protein JJ937_07630, partial [Parvibaculum sp.]|uniref:hypothetical protein n=1 Tax=Parvibaculum sp. TaxID=2024848 RepID=UPI001B12E93A
MWCRFNIVDDFQKGTRGRIDRMGWGPAGNRIDDASRGREFDIAADMDYGGTDMGRENGTRAIRKQPGIDVA